MWTIYLSVQVWDDELARVAQKWADQCVDVDYKVAVIWFIFKRIDRQTQL